MSTTDAVQQFDADRAAAYDDRIRRLFPGYDRLQETVAAVLAANLPKTARLLVAGAGTGTEILQMGRAHPQWRFTAVDPSPAMMEWCRQKVADAGLDDRVEYVDAPVEKMPKTRSFDAATSLLVTHFIEGEEAKRHYFHSIAKRLTPGAPLVWADLYRPSEDDAFQRLWTAWRTQMHTHLDANTVAEAFGDIEAGISFVPPAVLERLATDAGLTSPTPIYRQLLWGAWVARRGDD